LDIAVRQMETAVLSGLFSRDLEASFRDDSDAQSTSHQPFLVGGDVKPSGPKRRQIFFVREGFLNLAGNEPPRFRVIDTRRFGGGRAPRGGGSPILKLILAIVQEKDSRRLIDALMDAQFQTTMLASTGGFLREGNTTIIIGTDEGRVDDALAVIQKICCVREKLISPVPPVVDPVSYIVEPVKVKVGGAIVSVLNVDRSVKI